MLPVHVGAYGIKLRMVNYYSLQQSCLITLRFGFNSRNRLYGKVPYVTIVTKILSSIGYVLAVRFSFSNNHVETEPQIRQMFDSFHTHAGQMHTQELAIQCVLVVNRPKPYRVNAGKKYPGGGNNINSRERPANGSCGENGKTRGTLPVNAGSIPAASTTPYIVGYMVIVTGSGCVVMVCVPLPLQTSGE